jgi:uncharacterized SAM-binding protein YcdF (DUF218 family)
VSFVLSKLLWPVAAPANFLLLVLIVSTALLFTRWRRFARGFIVAVVALLFALAVLPVGQWLIAPLENRFPRPEALPAQVDGIVILGGAIGTELMDSRGEISLGGMAERFVAAIALMRRYPEARIVYTGGDPTLFGLGGNPVEADAARALFASVGADAGRIVFEPKARNTHENAVLSKQAMQPAPGEVWLLVTSAFHMPRSVGVFRKQGWDVVPYPVDYLTNGSWWRSKGLDLTGELSSVTLALREWIGLVSYWLLDHSDAVFPAPAES